MYVNQVPLFQDKRILNLRIIKKEKKGKGLVGEVVNKEIIFVEGNNNLPTVESA